MQSLDLRGYVVGTKAAAELVGISRTQLWRLTKANAIPHTITGVPDGRPVHLYRTEDLKLLARRRAQRSAGSIRRELKRMDRELRSLLHRHLDGVDR